MAHTLKIVKVDYSEVESDVVDFGSTLVSYIPSSKTLNEYLNDPNDPIVESAEYVLEGAAISNLESEIHDIELAFVNAALFQDGIIGSYRYYIKYQPDGGTRAYRSEILNGRVSFDEELLGYEWHNKKLSVLVSWERRPFWEATTETELSISNGNGSGTGGITIWNHSDSATHDNHVIIAAGDVKGSISAPARLNLENKTGASVSYHNFYLSGHRYYKDSWYLNWILEGENATGMGSNVDANSSAGYFGRIAATSGGATAYWTLSSAAVSAAAGSYYKILARFATAPTSSQYVRIQAKVGGVKIWEGDKVQLSADGNYKLQELGMIQIPPSITGIYSSGALELALVFYGSGNIDLDFAQLTQADAISLISKTNTYSIPNNEFLVDDGPRGIVYGKNSSFQKVPLFAHYGDHVHLRPGEKQFILFLCDETNLDMDISMTHTVRVYYRPRVLTI